MPLITHDATPDITVHCDALGPEWNGWAVPLWIRPAAMAGALAAVLGDGAVVTHDSNTVDVLCADGEHEEFTRGPDGFLSGEGWCWLTIDND